MKSTTYTARQLRIVNNNTADFDGGYSIELADGSIVAGPYATKDDAKTAKADIIAGRQSRQAG
jgi:hypothetical protein